MSHIIGWFGNPGISPDPGMNSSFVTAVTPPSCKKVNHHSFTLAGTSQCQIVNAESISVCIHGQPRWREASLQARSEELGLAETVAQLFTKYGPRLPSLLQGGFSLAVYDQ